MDDKYYVSKEKLEELKHELETLKTTRRLEVGERLRTAKEYGDVSENTEYEQAREEQMQLETRIAELDEMLKRAVIIKKSSSTASVGIGSIVSLNRDGKTVKYEIVGSEETQPEGGRISNESPLGRSFLGHKVGDKITVTTPVGSVVYEVIKID